MQPVKFAWNWLLSTQCFFLFLCYIIILMSTQILTYTNHAVICMCKFKSWAGKFPWGVKRQNIAGCCQQTFENKKFVDISLQSFTLLPQVNFPANNLNLNWRWRWWYQIQIIFLNLFYFDKLMKKENVDLASDWLYDVLFYYVLRCFKQ